MAVIRPQTQNRQFENYYQGCLRPDTLKAITPKSDSLTIIRPYPKIVDGAALPMVLGEVDGLPDFSAIAIENTVVNTGLGNSKFSGLTRPADQNVTEINRPFEGTYIRLKGGLNKQKFSYEVKQMVDPCFLKTRAEGSTVDNQPMSQPRATLLMQCACLTLRGQDLGDKPILNGCLFATGSLLDNLNACLTEAHQKGIDVFDPANGYTLVISALPPSKKDGRQTAVYQVALGEQLPVDVGLVQQNTFEWDDVLNLLTFEDQIKTLCNVFDPEIIRVAFPNEVNRIMGGAAPIQTQPARPAATGQVQLGRQARPLGTTPPAGASPAPAARPALGASAGAAQATPAARPTLGAAAAPPAARPALGLRPAATTPEVKAASAEDLEREFNALVEQQQGEVKN
jgi:hypothetical protein